MLNEVARTSSHSSRVLVALVLCAALAVQCQQLSQHRDAGGGVPVSMTEQLPAAAVVTSVTSQDQELALRDPLAFLYRCRDNYDRHVRDYTCTFLKQERVADRLTPEQETVVKFRQAPYSVNMRWVRNADAAAHVTYIEGRWPDESGQDQAWCEPAGAVVRLFVSKILQPIHGKRAAEASRRTIDQFGFRNTLDLIIRYSEQAAEEGALDLRYVGPGSMDGRPTYLFERRLPYTGQEKPYPDRLLVFHVDQEWLLPTACFSYADENRQDLLGRYVLTDVDFNQGLTDSDFGPESLDM